MATAFPVLCLFVFILILVTCKSTLQYSIFIFPGTDEARCMLRELLKPLSVLGSVNSVDSSWSGNGVDITPLIEVMSMISLLSH